MNEEPLFSRWRGRKSGEECPAHVVWFNVFRCDRSFGSLIKSHAEQNNEHPCSRRVRETPEPLINFTIIGRNGARPRLRRRRKTLITRDPYHRFFDLETLQKWFSTGKTLLQDEISWIMRKIYFWYYRLNNFHKQSNEFALLNLSYIFC